MPFFQKKELDPALQADREKIIQQLTEEVENKYRENFNFACLFQEQEQDGIFTKYAGIVACILILINIIISWK